MKCKVGKEWTEKEQPTDKEPRTTKSDWLLPTVDDDVRSVLGPMQPEPLYPSAHSSKSLASEDISHTTPVIHSNHPTKIETFSLNIAKHVPLSSRDVAPPRHWSSIHLQQDTSPGRPQDSSTVAAINSLLLTSPADETNLSNNSNVYLERLDSPSHIQQSTKWKGKETLSEPIVQPQISTYQLKPSLYHTEVKNEMAGVPVTSTHLNILSVLPQQDAMIELLPRSKRKRLNNNNEVPPHDKDTNISTNIETQQLQVEYEQVVKLPNIQDTLNHISRDLKSLEDEEYHNNTLTITANMESEGIPSTSTIGNQPGSELNVKTTATTPRAMKQKSANKFLKTKVYNYKWPDSWPDDPLDQTENSEFVSLIANDHMEPEFDFQNEDNWLSPWPLEKACSENYQTSSKNMKHQHPENLHTSEDVFLEVDSKEKWNEIGKRNLDFDDDIETDVFEEEGPSLDIADLEKSVNSVLSNMELEEELFLRYLQHEKYVEPTEAIYPELFSYGSLGHLSKEEMQENLNTIDKETSYSCLQPRYALRDLGPSVENARLLSIGSKNIIPERNILESDRNYSKENTCTKLSENSDKTSITQAITEAELASMKALKSRSPLTSLKSNESQQIEKSQAINESKQIEKTQVINESKQNEKARVIYESKQIEKTRVINETKQNEKRQPMNAAKLAGNTQAINESQQIEKTQAITEDELQALLSQSQPTSLKPNESQQTKKTLPSSESQQIEKTQAINESKQIEKTQAINESKQIEKTLPTSESQQIEKTLPTNESQQIEKTQAINESKQIEKTQAINESKQIEKTLPTSESQQIEKTLPTNESQQIEKTQAINESKQIEKTVPTNESQQIEKTQAINESKQIEKTLPTNESQQIEKTQAINESKQIEKTLPTSESQQIEKTQAINESKHTEKPLPMNESQQIEKTQIINESKHTEKPLPTNESQQIEKTQIINESKHTEKTLPTNESQQTEKTQAINESKPIEKTLPTNESQQTEKTQAINESKQNEKTQAIREFKQPEIAQAINESKQIENSQAINEFQQIEKTQAVTENELQVLLSQSQSTSLKPNESQQTMKTQANQHYTTLKLNKNQNSLIKNKETKQPQGSQSSELILQEDIKDFGIQGDVNDNNLNTLAHNNELLKTVQGRTSENCVTEHAVETSDIETLFRGNLGLPSIESIVVNLQNDINKESSSNLFLSKDKDDSTQTQQLQQAQNQFPDTNLECDITNKESSTFVEDTLSKVSTEHKSKTEEETNADNYQCSQTTAGQFRPFQNNAPISETCLLHTTDIFPKCATEDSPSTFNAPCNENSQNSHSHPSMKDGNKRHHKYSINRLYIRSHDGRNYKVVNDTSKPSQVSSTNYQPREPVTEKSQKKSSSNIKQQINEPLEVNTAHQFESNRGKLRYKEELKHVTHSGNRHVDTSKEREQCINVNAKHKGSQRANKQRYYTKEPNKELDELGEKNKKTQDVDTLTQVQPKTELGNQALKFLEKSEKQRQRRRRRRRAKHKKQHSREESVKHGESEPENNSVNASLTVQRLYINTPGLAFPEPLNIPLSTTVQQSSLNQSVQRLLVRSPNFEEFIGFPTYNSVPSSLPNVPDKQLLNVKPFADLSNVPLASVEDLRSLSSSNFSLQNSFLSFISTSASSFSLNMEGIQQTSLLATSQLPTRWISLPSLLTSIVPMSVFSPSSRHCSDESIEEMDSYSSLKKAISVPSTLHKKHVSTGIEECRDDSKIPKRASKPKTQLNDDYIDWNSLIDDEEKLHTSCSSVTSGYSIEEQKPFSAKKSTSSLKQPEHVKHDKRYQGKSGIWPSKKSRSSSHIVHNRSFSDYPETLAQSRAQGPYSSNPLDYSNPWYLQTEFLLSPSSIPSGYCTWVSTPNQPSQNGGKSASVGIQELASDTKLSSPASETSQVENLKSPAVEEPAHAKSSVEEKSKHDEKTKTGKGDDQETGRDEKQTSEDKTGRKDAIPVIEIISENEKKLKIEELGDKLDTVLDDQKSPTPGKDLTGGKITEEPLAKQMFDQIKKETDEIIITKPLISEAREIFEEQSGKHPEKLPKIKEFQSESKPIVTTPTLSRRGLGGSQRLSRDQRPPPLDVSHMIISDEGTDEDMGSAGYIVTEPSEEKPDKNKKSEIYRINSSPDILTDPKILPPQHKADKEKMVVCESKTAEKDVPGSVKLAKSDIPKPFIPIEEVLETPVSDTAAELEASSPILFSVEQVQVEQQPTFHDKFEFSTGQTMEDIEALIEKANRDLAQELERAGVCLTDAGDESAEEDLEKHEEKAETFEKQYDLSAAVGEEVIQKPDYEEPNSDKKEKKDVSKSEKEEKKLRRVERRFERMASETLEKEAEIEGSTAPEMEKKREAEFERMVSQLSYEEVTDCQKEYMQLLDEGGLTPSEDWDSRDPDTPSGELDEEAASPTVPSEMRTVHTSSILKIPKIVIDCCNTPEFDLSDPFGSDDESTDPSEVDDDDDYQSELFKETESNGVPADDNQGGKVPGSECGDGIPKSIVNDATFCIDNKQSSNTVEESSSAKPFRKCCFYTHPGPHISWEPCSLEQSPLESTRPLTAELKDRQEPQVAEPLVPTPTPRHIPKPESQEDLVTTSPMEPVGPISMSGEVSPAVSHISIHRVSVGISPSDALEDSKVSKTKQDESKPIEEDIQSYSDRKKFWEQMTATGQAKPSDSSAVMVKQRTLSQESVAPPVPKPRSSIPSPAPLISVLQESGIIKSEAESDTETTTYSDSTIRMHPPPASVSKQSTFTGSSDTSDREGSETEAADTQTPAAGEPTTAESVVAVLTKQKPEEEGSSDSEAEYLAKCGDEPLAYENTAFVSDEDIDRSIQPEQSLKELSTTGITKKMFERSVSLPTEDLTPFDANGSSVRAKKRYFEAQIKKEMVVEQLMTQLEEEASPEHKSIHQAQAKPAPDQEKMVTRQIHSDIFTHALEETIESAVPEEKDIVSKEEQEGVRTVKDIAKGFEKPKVIKDELYKASDKITTEVKVLAKKSSLEQESQQERVMLIEKEESKPTIVKQLAKGFEKEPPTEKTSATSATIKPSEEKEHPEAETKVSSVKALAKGFEKIEVKETKLIKDIMQTEKSKVQPTEEHEDTVKIDQDAEEENKLLEKELASEIKRMESEEDTEYRLKGSIDLVPSEEISEQVAEVMHYKTETISKPSDSLEVHVDKSETEETEKERDIDEDLKVMEMKQAEDEGIPSITVTLSGKQRTESYSQGESEDTQSESDVTPEDAHTLYQPEEHVHDTVWEVPVQEQPETIIDEMVQEIPIEKQIILEKDEELETQKITKDEAKVIAEEVVESIEAEVAKRATLIGDVQEAVSPPVPPPEMAETQVTEYLRQLAGKEELEPREVQLMESVLARKHREEMKKLSRTDTATSSMEITDEDLRSSGVETDLSPLESQAAPHLQECEDTEIPQDDLKLQDEEVVEKTLAEVRESLEAAQEQLIEQHKQKEEIIQKKESPSEFEFKVLTFEKTIDESIEESHYEEVSATADFAESVTSGQVLKHTAEATVKSKDDTYEESKKTEGAEISFGKDGIELQKDIIQQEKDRHEVKATDSTLEDVAIITSDTEVPVGEQRISAAFSDEEECSLSSKLTETETKDKAGGIVCTTVKEEKEATASTSEEKVVIETKLGETEVDSSYEKDVTKAQSTVTKKEEKETKVEEIKEIKTGTETKTVITEGQKGSRIFQETVFETVTSSTVIGKDAHSKETFSAMKAPEEILETYTLKELDKKTEEATKPGMKPDVTKTFKVESELTEKIISFLPEVMKTPSDSEKVTEKEEMKRTSSEESQRSLSQDESIKSPVDSSSSSGRRTEATELIRTIERPDGSETTVVVLRHPHPPKSTDADSSSSGERGATLRTERRSGADFEAWSSSGESHYHSFEQTSESGRTYSRPCSSDVEALMGGVGTAGSSEYESALTSQEISARSTSVTSHEYHTAVSSLSSRDSMKSLDSESSGHLASIEVSSEASETLVPSALELEKDMEGTGALAMDEDDVERQDFVLSCPPVIEESLEEMIMVEPYDTAIPVHVIRGESPPSVLDYDKHDGTSSYLQDVAGSSSGIEKIDDGRTSPFEILDYPIEETVSEDETEIHDSHQQSEMQATLDGTKEDERPHCMKRSHEMIFQPEPRPIITESPLSETATDLQEEKLGSSVEEGSVLSVSLSSASDAAGLTTVIEVSRAESEQMAISASSEQLDFDDLDAPVATQLVDSGTCTYTPVTSAHELHLSSVTITTSSVEESGVQSVCTQVTSQSHTPVQEEAFGDDEEDGTHKEPSQLSKEEEYPQSNGPTQVEYVPEYDDYDDSRKRHMGHRRKESTSTFVPSRLPTMTDEAPKQAVRPIPELSPMKSETDEMAESDKYTETGPMTLKEVRSDEKKDVDEAERLEESYQTEADQGFHRDLREGRVILEDVISIEDEPEAEFDTSRPQSQVSKSDSEGGHRPMSSGFSDDRPDSELAELLKQCSEGGKDLEDPIERPMSPEPADECEIKDDTPEFSSEAQASITELEMEYSGAFSRSVEYASHVSPIREERVGVHYEEAYSMGEWTEPTTDHEEEMAEAEAAFQMAPHAHSMMTSLPPTIPEDPLAEKHELETRDKDLQESKAHKEALATSPGSIPDITVTQHMTPLVDRGFHYPDLELEEEAVAKSTPQTPASVSSRASSETETDQGREYILEDEEQDDFISEEPELEQEDKQTESRSVDEVSAAEDKTVYETGVTADKKEEPPSPTTESPESDSFEMLEKPDLTDEYVVIEEVGKEAEEHDTEGKSVQIGKKTHSVKKVQPKVEEDLISSPPAPATRMTDIKYYPEPGEDMGPFPFDSDSPPTAATTTKSVGVRAKGYGYEAEEYDREVEAGKKWIEMQFQGNGAATVPPGYGYEMEFERGPLEDIKEEEINDFDQSSSKVGSMGSYKGSIGSFGSVKESLSSTPEYDVLAGRKFFTRSGEHDDVSMSSLQEFEQLERQIALESARKRSHGSQDSLNGAKKSSYGSGSSGRSGQGDDISLSSLKEFEGLETLCIEAAKIETRAKEEEALLSEIEEGHESQISESESCETMSVGGVKGILGGGGESVDSDDYEKRIFEIDEIIRQAQSNVERFVDIKERDDLLDKTESVGRGDSMEEVARVPELDLDQPLYSQHGILSSSFTSKVAEATSWRDASEDIVKTSSDSLDFKDRSKHDPLHTSTDSLDMKTVADKSGDVMTTSADSIEFQVPGQGDIMTDSMELPIDTGESAAMATSTDSLDLGATGAAVLSGAAMTDSIEEEEEMSILGQAEGQGSGSGGQDQSSSSGREGDLSSSGRDDNSGEQGRVPPPRADMMLGSTDSLEPSSSTATHATYQYETDSVMSSSFTSGGSNTMVSSTDTLDPTGAAAGGLDAIDLAAAARSAGVWFEEGSGKPFVTEVIEPSEEDEFSHTIRRTVELPPEVRKVSFKGPDAERALKEYVEQFAPGEDVTETQEVDAEGNVHIKRVVQRRVVVRTEDLADIELTGPEIEEYIRKVSEQRKETQEDDVPESDYTHLMTSITGEPFPSSQSTEVVTHQTYVTRHMTPSVTHGAVVSTTKQGLTSTPNLTGTMAMSDWEQEKAAVSGEAPPDVGVVRDSRPQLPSRHLMMHDISVDEDYREVDFSEHDWRFYPQPTPELPEEGEGSDSPGVRRSVEQTTDTRVVDGGTVTRTVTTTTTTSTVHGDSGSVQKLQEEGKPSPQ